MYPCYLLMAAPYDKTCGLSPLLVARSTMQMATQRLPTCAATAWHRSRGRSVGRARGGWWACGGPRAMQSACTHSARVCVGPTHTAAQSTDLLLKGPQYRASTGRQRRGRHVCVCVPPRARCVCLLFFSPTYVFEDHQSLAAPLCLSHSATSQEVNRTCTCA